MKGGGLTKPGGHYNEMGTYASGILNRAATYWKNCRKCDGNPSIPESVLDPVNEYNKQIPPLIVPRCIMDLSPRYITEIPVGEPIEIPQPMGAPLIPFGLPVSGWLGQLVQALAH